MTTVTEVIESALAINRVNGVCDLRAEWEPRTGGKPGKMLRHNSVGPTERIMHLPSM